MSTDLFETLNRHLDEFEEKQDGDYMRGAWEALQAARAVINELEEREEERKQDALEHHWRG